METSATRQDAGAGGLRADLLYQLNTVEIVAPPLRDMRDDIPVLADHFLRLYAARYDRPARLLSNAASQVLAGSAWRCFWRPPKNMSNRPSADAA